MVLLATVIVGWAEEGAPQSADPGQGQHQWGGGPQRPGDGGRRQFGQEGRGGEFGGRGMGWQHGGRGRFGGGDHLLRLAENPRVRQYLGLTDDQVGRLHKIGIDAEKASVQTRADMQLRHIELGELLRADNPDHDAIMQKLDEVNTLQGKMQKQHVETLLSARSVLTPEQLKKVKTFMENRGRRRPGTRTHDGAAWRHGTASRPPWRSWRRSRWVYPETTPARKNCNQGLPPVVRRPFSHRRLHDSSQTVVAALGDLSAGPSVTLTWSSRMFAAFLWRDEGQINGGRCTFARSASLPLCTPIPCDI